MSNNFLTCERLHLPAEDRALIEPILTEIEKLANDVFTTSVDEEIIYPYFKTYNRELSRLLIRKLIELDLTLSDPPFTVDELLLSILTRTVGYD